MKKTVYLSLISLIILLLGCKLEGQLHNNWSTLLKQHVSSTGLVDYKGFKANENVLDQYLNTLSETDWISLNTSDQKAFWINAYNAFTIKAILNHYPVASIMDIKVDDNTIWDVPFITINNKPYTLNDIEHRVLLEDHFDPRIHFVINCAAASCPPLANKAYNGRNLDNQMETVTRSFIQNETFNQIKQNKVQLSKIFDWYKDDFTKSGNLLSYINQYSKKSVSSDAMIIFNEYDWSINKQ